LLSMENDPHNYSDIFFHRPGDPLKPSHGAKGRWLDYRIGQPFIWFFNFTHR